MSGGEGVSRERTQAPEARGSTRDPLLARADVSIIVSAYRSESYLPRFARDVHAFAREIEATSSLVVELVFVLNEPSGTEVRAFDALRRLQSPQVRTTMVRVPRESLYASWNRGIRTAEGDVLGFWNVDDERFAPAVMEAVQRVGPDSGLMYFPYLVERRWRLWRVLPCRRCLLEPARGFDPQVFRRIDFPLGPFFLFSRTLYDAVGPFDEQFRVAGDLDWYFRALDHTVFARGTKIAGVFFNECRGLSTLGSARLLAEREVIFGRHGLVDPRLRGDPGLVAGYDARRMRVGRSWVDLTGSTGTAIRGSELREVEAPGDLELIGKARSLRRAAASGQLDGRLSRVARVTARQCEIAARRGRAAARREHLAVAREELETRLCRGDLHDARREFLRVRPAYVSGAKFAAAAPLVMASPRLYASCLRRMRRPRARSSATGGLP